MKLEHFGMAEPGDCRVVFSAAAEELEAAVQAEKTAPDAPQDEDDLLTAVNTGSRKTRGALWYSVGRYVYVPLALVLCLVALIGGVAF